MKLALLFASLAFTASAAMPEGYAERLADAIWHAEGGNRAKVSHGILSVPTRSAEHARTICLNTVKRTWDRWEAAGRPGEYLDFLGNRYAPIGAKNDPKGLNRNWVRNVRSRLSVTNREHNLNARSRYSVESR